MWKREVVATKRGAFEVFTKGKGAPLCVTHHYSEFNETGDYFADTFTETHTVHLINLRGAGGSVEAEEPYQLGMLETVFDLEAVREALDYEKWAFAGHSIGGMLGVLYGIFFSEKLNGAVITGSAARDYATLSPACIYNPSHPQFEKMQQLIETLKLDTLSEAERKERTMERTKLSLVDPDAYPALFDKPIHKRIASERLNFFNREFPLFDVTRKLPWITTPVLILCGKFDVQCPLEYSVEMEQLIPDASLIVFEQSNHYPFLEEQEKFKAEIQRFTETLAARA
ncbi:alpha/beta hydrolase [Halobacillus sp. ACCC02827]|uniref:alpha/beta fold hydrolase n=1 Tax=unclassified Halobacillus TaxID=2636472 RepID=UPI0002A4FEA0|nr:MULTISPECIES: alpha/beta hydrolase [unclassified Halobacillus]ELK46496.1 prolyl aminopeptidase [Halobacillus sp. BAB-2008]WJE16963.1 alpha/beta hydrolase [Halobacillus sp. ACCC02827]